MPSTRTPCRRFSPRRALLTEKLTAAIDRDTEAFDGVSAVFAMPKSTDEEKAARKEAMQKALKEATLVPYETMELCLQSLKVVKLGVGKTNTSAASDLGVASLNLKSAVQGAWLNVLINLAGIKDEAFVTEYKSKGEAILAEALPAGRRNLQRHLKEPVNRQQKREGMTPSLFYWVNVTFPRLLWALPAGG